METPPERNKNEAKLLICTQLTRGSFLQTLYHIGPVRPAITARTGHYCGQWPQSSRNKKLSEVLMSGNYLKKHVMTLVTEKKNWL